METLVKKEGTLSLSTNKKNEVNKEMNAPKPLNSHQINLKMHDYMIF